MMVDDSKLCKQNVGRFNHQYTVGLCAILVIFCSVNVYANDSVPSTAWDIGLNAAFRQSPFVGGEGQVGVSPRRLKYGKLRRPGLTLPLLRDANWIPYLGIGFDEWDYQRGDSAILQDMHALKRAVNLRAGVVMPLGNKAQLTAELGKDMAGAHKGLQAKARYTQNITWANREIQPYIEAQGLSAELTDYYVGVNNDEVAQNRAAYTADADVALKVGVNYRQKLSGALTLIGGVNLTGYGSEISDSPIIENDLIWGGNLGMTYRWK